MGTTSGVEVLRIVLYGTVVPLPAITAPPPHPPLDSPPPDQYCTLEFLILKAATDYLNFLRGCRPATNHFLIRLDEIPVMVS